MPSVDFALIGHLESWSTAAAVISALRGAARPAIRSEELREILPWIPPRTVCRVTITSSNGSEAHGVYIDSFIPPDRLAERFLRENLARVRQAAEYAVREGAKIAALGGFSSILLEGNIGALPRNSRTAFTTGNTLTVALIMRGLECALELAGRDLGRANVLIIGASGDVGSGCARCLAPRVSQLLLCARNPNRLQALATELSESRTPVHSGTDLAQFSSQADLVICAASMPAPALSPEALSPEAIICDVGYPKNLLPGFAPAEGAVFFGGLGQVRGRLRLHPDLLGILNPQPFPDIVHGCLLEGMLLALDRRFEPFSQGRGRITPQRVQEIWDLAQKHGITLGPLCDADGPVEARISDLAGEVR
jgi:fatty aldehyde-generating acyl-ACP reductase